MILSAQSIRRRSYDGLISPFFERAVFEGLSFGLSPAGYDIRIGQDVHIRKGDFHLASTMEHFDMPLDLLARVTDKSTWARRGLCVQNTVIEPGWRGYLTLELTNHSTWDIFLVKGMGIAQIIFETLDELTQQPYTGKYQDQDNRPVEPLMEKP